MNNLNKNTIFIALGTLVVGLVLGWLIFSGTNGDHRTAEMHDHEENTVWTCSMHPQIRQAESGQCPICGMDLIPLNSESNDEDHPSQIIMSETAMQLASIQTTIITKENPVKEIRLNGKVKADERRVFSQSSHIPGRIEKLSVNFTGERVKKGQVLANVYSPDLVTAQEELFEANKIKESQPELFLAARGKLFNWKLTETQIEHILESKQIQEQFPVLADVSGVVLNKKIKLGDYIQKGQSLFEIADLSIVWVLFDIYESDLAWIQTGDEVIVSVQSYPGESINGKISFIDPVINPSTRVATARVELKNPRSRLKPDMFALGVVNSTLEHMDGELTVPKSAVMWTGERSLIYVKHSPQSGISFEMREVSLGPALSNSYVITDGLMEGEEIAVNGTFSIDAAAQLAGKPSMMNTKLDRKNNHLHNSSSRKDHNHVVKQNKKLLTESIKVYGNCNMCKKTIEGAVSSMDGVSLVNWNKDTKILNVKYNSDITSVESIKRSIADVGYDTDDVRASDDSYHSLHDCCKYERPGNN